MLIDTHAHIQGDEYEDVDRVIDRSTAAGVTKIICVGTDHDYSQKAVELARLKDNIWASVGLHPHDADFGDDSLKTIKELASDPKVVAIGECGLDYYYNHSPREDQLAAFKSQIELALEVKKPLIFHVREAFDDFFEVVDNYQNLSGVVHCFSSDTSTMNKALERGFYIAFNGIMTFTKDQSQLDAAKTCPIDKILLETDCPYLTPAPHRGQRNEPANTRVIAEFLANLRGESFDELATATTKNAERLFNL